MVQDQSKEIDATQDLKEATQDLKHIDAMQDLLDEE